MPCPRLFPGRHNLVVYIAGEMLVLRKHTSYSDKDTREFALILKDCDLQVFELCLLSAWATITPISSGEAFLASFIASTNLKKCQRFPVHCGMKKGEMLLYLS